MIKLLNLHDKTLNVGDICLYARYSPCIAIVTKITNKQRYNTEYAFVTKKVINTAKRNATYNAAERKYYYTEKLIPEMRISTSTSYRYNELIPMDDYMLEMLFHPVEVVKAKELQQEILANNCPK
jgi:hypothetical protein